MDVQKWLEQVGMLDQLINAKNAERERLMDIATDISPNMDGMPFDNTGMVSRRVENSAVKLVMLAREIDALIDKYIDYKNEVINALEKLPKNEYGVLHRHYIRYMTWEQVAEEMGYSTVQVWRIKNKALENLKDIITKEAVKV